MWEMSRGSEKITEFNHTTLKLDGTLKITYPLPSLVDEESDSLKNSVNFPGLLGDDRVRICAQALCPIL